jgi:hypothetical protein
MKTPVVNGSEATESKSAEDLPEGDNQTTKALLISDSFTEIDNQTTKALLISHSFTEIDNQTTKALLISHSFTEIDTQTTKALLIDDSNGTFYPDRITSVGPPHSDKPHVSSNATPNITTDTGPALNTSLIVVNGVLLVCTVVGGGFILVQLLKKLRKRSEVSEHYEVCVPLTETGSSLHVSSRLSLSSTYATGHIYETIE